jgi:hypothetical protein
VIIILYVAIAVVCIYPFGLAATDVLALGSDDSVGAVLAILGAVCLAALWPVVLTVWAAFRISRAIYFRAAGVQEPPMRPDPELPVHTKITRR